MAIVVINRSFGNVGYELPELNVRRVFTVGEQKIIDKLELEALSQADGGLELLKNYLLVQDKEWVEQHFNPPIEYWWRDEEVKRCLLEEDLDLFSETLDYAPEGVLEMIKTYAWRIPITDLNKIQALRDKTDFDVLSAVKIMSAQDDQ